MNKSRIPALINQLAKKCSKLSQPIHVIAVCSGGRTVGKYIVKYLKKNGIDANYFEAWTNIINDKATVNILDFKLSDYKGTVLIAEDVIWNGTSVMAVKKTLNRIKRKKVYLAVLLDMNKKADFSVFN